MTVPLIARPRLVHRLTGPDAAALVVLDSLPGFGRTTLLTQTAATIPGAVVHRCRPGDAPSDLRGVDAGVGIVLLDEVEALDAAALDALFDLIGRDDASVRIVLSGRGVAGDDLPRRLAAGTADILLADDLAFTPEEVDAVVELRGSVAGADVELLRWPALASLVLAGREHAVEDYLRDVVLGSLGREVARTVAAVVAVRGGIRPVCDAAVSAVDPHLSTHVGRAIAIPMISAGLDAAGPHAVWDGAVADLLTGDERRAACVAAAHRHLSDDDLVSAGDLALASGDGRTIAAAIGAGLSSQPPRVGRSVLQAWARRVQDVYPPATDLDDHRTWLAGVLAATSSDRSASAAALLEDARERFARSGDIDAECAVLCHLGTHARQRDDLATLARLVQRAGDLRDAGSIVAAALCGLGEATVAQMVGDNAGALRALDAAPLEVFDGDWAAQARMVRGTILALGDQADAACRELRGATGIGSGWSRAVAWDLLGSVLWWAGDPLAALEAADEAVRLADLHGATTTSDQARAARLCMWVARRDPRALAELDALTGMRTGATEAAALIGVARALDALQRGDGRAARTALGEVHTRRVRSLLWSTALRTALDPPPGDATEVAPEVGRDPLGPAREAGRAGARYLVDGTRAGPEARPFLPSGWCDVGEPPIELRLLGRAEVRRDGDLVVHDAWNRSRVRELALRLALDVGGSRARVAADLWPDLAPSAATRNLRVTLTYLLDVLDPGRGRGQGSSLLIDRPGCLALSEHVRVDLRELRRLATDVAEGLRRADEPDALAAARQVLARGPGRPLGGDEVGEWAEAPLRELEDLVVRSITAAIGPALARADHDLVEALARRILTLDPWSETAHAALLSVRLQVGDADAARRAATTLVAALDELGSRPSPKVALLIQRARRSGTVGRSPAPSP